MTPQRPRQCKEVLDQGRSMIQRLYPSLFLASPTSDRFMKIVGSSVALTHCLQATDILSTLAGVTPYVGSLITSLKAGVGCLA